jgi:uncharacterized protein involved in exopolysaccharide biosynthesis
MYAEKRENGSKQPLSGKVPPGPGQAVFAYYPISASEEDVISLFDVWQILTRYKWVIVAVTSVCALAATLAALLMTPRYKAEVFLIPVSEAEDQGRYTSQLGAFAGIATLAGINLDRGDRKNEAIATLKSRMLTEQFIKDEKLRPVLFHKLWDAKAQRWDVDDPDDVPTLWDAYELFDEKLRRVYEDKTTGLVVLAIEWEDPELAARWANELVRRVNAMLRNRAAEQSENAVGYLQEQLKLTSVVELQQVLHRLIEAEMKEIILANINKEYAFRVIDPATVPEEPFKPRMVPMVVVGGGVGVIAGIMLALLLNLARRRREIGVGT